MNLRFYTTGLSLIVLLAHSLASAAVRPHQELRDIFYGEILYHAYQEDFFEAISHLDNELGQYYALDEPELDSFNWHQGQAEFAVGDLELSYRMHLRAGRAIETVLADNVAADERNEAAYRLARLYFRKQDYLNALHSIERIEGEVPEKIRSDESFLRAQIFVAVGKFEQAIKLLQALKGDAKYRGYIEYNLAMAYLQSAQTDLALAALDDLGTVSTDDKAVLALKDKGNLKLAYYYLDTGDAVKAKEKFSRVRLDGPFSNRALLGLGWVEVSQDRFDRALIPWSILHEREQTNYSVQEVMMAVPYAYSKLDVHSNAAINYGRAMDVFTDEIDSLDASIKSIREGKFLVALVSKQSEKDKNWVVNLRELPDSPETRYIMELLAAHDFQESLKNYKDLAKLRQHLGRWLDNLTVFEEVIEIRRQYYTPLLPEVEKEFKKLDSRIRLRIEQRDQLNERIRSLLVSRRPEYLATADERSAIDRLARMKVDIEANPAAVSEDTVYRMKRLSGLLDWRLNSEFSERLTVAYKNLQDLDGVIDDLNKQYRAFVRTRQAATQSYEGYTIPIQQLRTRLRNTQVKLKGIMARQGRVLEQLAINELDKRRKRLEEYQIKARFALAESYDRATKAEEKKQEQKLLQQQAAAGAKTAPVEEVDNTTPADVPTEQPEEKPAEQPADDPVDEQATP